MVLQGRRGLRRPCRAYSFFRVGPQGLRGRPTVERRSPRRPEGPPVNRPGRQAGTRTEQKRAPQARHQMHGIAVDVPALRASLPIAAKPRADARGYSLAALRAFAWQPLDGLSRPGLISTCRVWFGLTIHGVAGFGGESARLVSSIAGHVPLSAAGTPPPSGAFLGGAARN